MVYLAPPGVNEICQNWSDKTPDHSSQDIKLGLKNLKMLCFEQGRTIKVIYSPEIHL